MFGVFCKHRRECATIMGVYRFWRDLGYAVGALLYGVVADLLGMRAAIGGSYFLSGVQVAFRMRETLRTTALRQIKEGSLRMVTGEQSGNE